MIRLTEVTEENWPEVASLAVRDDQRDYVAPAVGILARGYAYRACNSRVFVIENDGAIVGTALVREFSEEPLGYDLQQFMIDRRYQRRGYGLSALRLILDELRRKAIGTMWNCVSKRRIPRRSGSMRNAAFRIPDMLTGTCRIR